MTALDSEVSVRAHPSGRPTVRDVVGAYVGLTKPRVIELLLLTTVPVMFFAQRGVPPLWLVVATVVGGTLSAGSANALNCVYDRDIDEQMRRTRRRALPRHIVTPRAAFVFGLVLVVVSTLVLGFWVNWLSAGLALAASAFYLFGYTMVLKRRTTQNIVWGGLAGLLPDADRVDRRHRRAGLAAGRALPGRLLLDAAAHLGAGDALPRGLRPGRRADASRGQGRRGRGPADRRLLLGDGRDVAGAVAGGRHGRALPGRRGRARGRVPGRGAPDVAARPAQQRAPGGAPDAAVPLVQHVSLAAVRRRRAATR